MARTLHHCNPGMYVLLQALAFERLLLRQELWYLTMAVPSQPRSHSLEDTVSLTIPIKRNDFCQTPLYNSGVTRFES